MCEDASDFSCYVLIMLYYADPLWLALRNAQKFVDEWSQNTSDSKYFDCDLMDNKSEVATQ